MAVCDLDIDGSSSFRALTLGERGVAVSEDRGGRRVSKRGGPGKGGGKDRGRVESCRRRRRKSGGGGDRGLGTLHRKLCRATVNSDRSDAVPTPHTHSHRYGSHTTVSPRSVLINARPVFSDIVRHTHPQCFDFSTSNEKKRNNSTSSLVRISIVVIYTRPMSRVRSNFK